ELDLVEDAQDREEGAQVGRHRLLEGEQLIHLLLDMQDQALDLAMRRVDAVDERKVGVEQRLRGGPDLLAALGRQRDHLGSDVLELLVERAPRLGHRASWYCS